MKWDNIWRPYAGAEINYQVLYDGSKRLGKIQGWDSDGDYGFDAYELINETYIGTFKTRRDAQRAIEAALKEV